MKDVMSSLGVRVDEAELREIIDTVDLDRNGTIDFREFCTMMSKKSESSDPEQEIQAVFRAIDKDRDGFISFEDLKASLSSVHWGSERPPSDDDVKQMIGIFDDRDSVDITTFRRIVKKFSF
jgi:Ca2+-binding EF-hand superfamily protein